MNPHRNARLTPKGQERLAGLILEEGLRLQAAARLAGVSVKRVISDNGRGYLSDAFAAAWRDLGLKHVRSNPCTPQTHGKAERFIQTAVREWALCPGPTQPQGTGHPT